MATRNLARGAKTLAFRQVVSGIKELEKQLAALDPSLHPEARKQMFEILGRAADHTADNMRRAARAAGWPGWIVDTIFSFSQARAGKSGAIVGVNKKRSMVEWRAGRNPKSPNAKVSPGGKVAMSRASMLEFGTSREPARPAIRGALERSQNEVIQMVADGFKALFESLKSKTV